MATPATSPSPPSPTPPSPNSQAVHALTAQFPALANSHRHVRCIVKLGEPPITFKFRLRFCMNVAITRAGLECAN